MDDKKMDQHRELSRKLNEEILCKLLVGFDPRFASWQSINAVKAAAAAIESDPFLGGGK